MLNKIQISLRLIISLATGIPYSQAQQKQVKLKPSDLVRDVHLGNGTTDLAFSADFRVLDGILMSKNVPEPKTLEFVDTKHIKDRDELSRMGVNHPDRSYSFYNSEVSESYKAIYQQASVPLEIRGLNLPLIIDGSLMTANQYSKISGKIGKVKSVKFVAKNAQLVKKYPGIELGVLEIIY